MRRVLREDGVVFLNLGDSYAGSGEGGGGNRKGNEHGQHDLMKGNRPKVAFGLKPKDMIGIPWRVAFALQADGWWLRQDIIWNKQNPMPESVTDRCTNSHEHVFLLSKSARYFFDQVAISEPETMKPQNRLTPRKENPNAKVHGMPIYRQQEGGIGGGTRNRRSVWTISTQAYSGSHFATMPRKLAETCIMAGTSEAGCCSQCGKPWERIIEKDNLPNDGTTNTAYQKGTAANRLAMKRQAARERGEEYVNRTVTLGFRPACTCNTPSQPCVVLDPFGGSGTTGEVAQHLGRKAILIELNPDYLPLIAGRTRQPSLDFNVGER